MTTRNDAVPDQAMESGDYAAVSAVIVRERQSRDRGWLKRMAAGFSLDATLLAAPAKASKACAQL